MEASLINSTEFTTALYLRTGSRSTRPFSRKPNLHAKVGTDIGNLKFPADRFEPKLRVKSGGTRARVAPDHIDSFFAG
jgi:hypothetical protein